MYSIFDVDNFRGEFGSTFTVKAFSDMSKRFKLKRLIEFFENGFSIDINGLRNDLEKIDFGFSELEEVRKDFLYAVNGSKKIIILTDDTQY